jgi:CRP-like cAMP-binding protein
VELSFGETLAEPNAPIRVVHFPLTCSIALVASAGAGKALEIGLVGTEGMLGATLALRASAALLRAEVHAPGWALQLSAAAFRRELRDHAAVRGVIQSYCLVRLMQVSQTVACTHYHSLEARLCRWLLMTQDRAAGPSVHLTQVFLSRVLGVRRVGVTHAAGVLQSLGLIAYHRGEMRILDRAGLMARACSCYAADLQIYDAVLG